LDQTEGDSRFRSRIDDKAPFPRLAINAELAKQEARVPEQVELTLAPQNRLTGKSGY